MKYIFDITPVPKPRLTRQGRFSEKAKTYYKYAEDLRLLAGRKYVVGDRIKLIFHVPMPSNWDENKKQAHDGKPHLQKPDSDNLCKAFLDALCEDDSYVWDQHIVKKWSRKGYIEVENL